MPVRGGCVNGNQSSAELCSDNSYWCSRLISKVNRTPNQMAKTKAYLDYFSPCYGNLKFLENVPIKVLSLFCLLLSLFLAQFLVPVLDLVPVPGPVTVLDREPNIIWFRTWSNTNISNKYIKTIFQSSTSN